jgi:hypothetical protein
MDERKVLHFDSRNPSTAAGNCLGTSPGFAGLCQLTPSPENAPMSDNRRIRVFVLSAFATWWKNATNNSLAEEQISILLIALRQMLTAGPEWTVIKQEFTL